MNIAPAAIKKTNAGSCPHGLPYGACPICSGAGGGGGGVSSKSTPRKAGEMSWDQCYAAWQQILKTKDAANQKKLDAMNAQMQPQMTFAGKIGNVSLKIALLAEKLADFAQKMGNLPKIIAKPLELITQLAIPILNGLKNITNFAQKTAEFIQQKLADISDKLNSIFGELKNSTEKRISEGLKNMKKSFKSLFGVLEPSELDEEKEQAEETQRLFELKSTMKFIEKKLFKNKELNDDNER